MPSNIAHAESAHNPAISASVSEIMEFNADAEAFGRQSLLMVADFLVSRIGRARTKRLLCQMVAAL